MTSAAVRSKAVGNYAVVYTLFAVAHIVSGGLLLGPCLVLQCFVSFLVLQSSCWYERAGCFTFVVF